MAEIIWTQPAYDDLDEISSYIALDKVSAAIKLVDKILDKVNQLAEHPQLGRQIPEFENTKYREIIVKPCRILYYFKNNKIYIVHVMRSERQLRRYMIHESQAYYKVGK